MKAKRELDGAVDKSSDREIQKSDAIVHNLWKIWRPVPSGIRPYGWLADEIWARFDSLKVCCRSKYLNFCFV